MVDQDFSPHDDEYLKEYSEEAMEAEPLFDPDDPQDQVIDTSALDHIVASRNRFSFIEEYEDAVSFGISIRQDMDQFRWNLGALVNFVCPSRKSGRPKEDVKVEKTLTEFAKDIGEDRSSLSQLAANDAFYDEDMRAELPQQLSWRHLAKARSKSGWRRGMKPPTEDHKRLAAQLLITWAEGGEIELPPKPIHRSAEDHARKIIVEAEKGMIAADDGMDDAFDLFDKIAEHARDILDMLGDMPDA